MGFSSDIPWLKVPLPLQPLWNCSQGRDSRASGFGNGSQRRGNSLLSSGLEFQGFSKPFSRGKIPRAGAVWEFGSYYSKEKEKTRNVVNAKARRWMQGMIDSCPWIWDLPSLRIPRISFSWEWELSKPSSSLRENPGIP